MGSRIVIQHILSNSKYAEYSNSIPAGRYRDYCGVECIRISFSFVTNFVLCMSYESGERVCSQHCCDSVDLSTTNLRVVTILPKGDVDVPPGNVSVLSDEINRIKLVHVICTYHRESRIADTLRCFEKFNDPDYNLVVVDNGSTLEESDGRITIIHSNNYGGSSGFARGIIHAKENGATHVILNDDDGKVEPESLFRVMAFLRLLKKKEVTISGIMFDENNPSVVYEAGAKVLSGRLVPLHRGLDVSNLDSMFQLMDEQSPDYSNWTLFCMPVSVIEANGLPLPVFIREDDVEYGLRSNTEMTTLLGFHVFHHTYPKRYSPVEHYYYVRNRLVALSSSGKMEGDIVDSMFYEMVVEVLAYRYECAHAMILGMGDYLRGPKYVYGLYKSGMQKFSDIGVTDLEELRESINIIENAPRSTHFSKIITINGLFRTTVGNVESEPSNVNISSYYRIKSVIYNLGNGKGLVRNREPARIVSMLLHIFLLKVKSKVRLSSVQKNYKDSCAKYSSEDYWRQALGLNKNMEK